MITLDEAIKHCKEVAEEKEREAEYRQKTQGDMFKFLDDLSKSVGGEGVENDALNDCLECAREHKQLAEWLKELKQFKEQEPCKDTVSRKEALKVIEEMDIPEDMSVFEIKSHISVEISTLPPATPKRKVGEWVKKNNDYFDWYECSECGYGSDGEMKYNRLCDVRTKFCPDCGSQNLKGE